MGKWSKGDKRIEKIFCNYYLKMTIFSIQCLNDKNNDQCADMKIRFCCPKEVPQKTLALIVGSMATVQPETQALKHWLVSKVELLKNYKLSITTYDRLEPITFTEMTEAYGALEMLTQSQDSGIKNHSFNHKILKYSS